MANYNELPGLDDLRNKVLIWINIHEIFRVTHLFEELEIVDKKERERVWALLKILRNNGCLVGLERNQYLVHKHCKV
jgi:hypothetical protein